MRASVCLTPFPVLSTLYVLVCVYTCVCERETEEVWRVNFSYIISREHSWEWSFWNWRGIKTDSSDIEGHEGHSPVLESWRVCCQLKVGGYILLMLLCFPRELWGFEAVQLLSVSFPLPQSCRSHFNTRKLSSRKWRGMFSGDLISFFFFFLIEV